MLSQSCPCLTRFVDLIVGTSSQNTAFSNIRVAGYQPFWHSERVIHDDDVVGFHE